MAHRISHQNGRDEIAYSGETPWHGLGVKVDGLQTVPAMLGAAGLTWTVGTFPLFCNSREVEGHKAIVRGDTLRVLGVATDRYVPIQNAQAGEIMDALITEGGAHVEVAGALDAGERCWMLAHIPADFEVVKHDLVKPYMLLAWGHDGKHGVAGKLTTVRVVCNNTLTAAGFGAGNKWSAVADFYLRHSGKVAVRIDEAQRALGVIRKQAEATAAAYQALAVPITSGQLVGYFQAVFPQPVEDIVRGPAASAPDTATHRQLFEEAMARWGALQTSLVTLSERGTGVEIPGVRGTAWAAYNAVTEYTDHVYPVLKSGELSARRQESVLFGSMGVTKQRALTEALALVGA